MANAAETDCGKSFVPEEEDRQPVEDPLKVHQERELADTWVINTNNSDEIDERAYEVPMERCELQQLILPIADDNESADPIAEHVDDTKTNAESFVLPSETCIAHVDMVLRLSGGEEEEAVPPPEDAIRSHTPKARHEMTTSQGTPSNMFELTPTISFSSYIANFTSSIRKFLRGLSLPSLTNERGVQPEIVACSTRRTFAFYSLGMMTAAITTILYSYSESKDFYSDLDQISQPRYILRICFCLLMVFARSAELLVRLCIWNLCRPGLALQTMAMIYIAILGPLFAFITYHVHFGYDSATNTLVEFWKFILAWLPEAVVPITFLLYSNPGGAQRRTKLQKTPMASVAFLFWVYNSSNYVLFHFFRSLLVASHIAGHVLIIPLAGAFIFNKIKRVPPGNNGACAVIQDICLDVPLTIGSVFIHLAANTNQHAIILLVFELGLIVVVCLWQMLSMEIIPRLHPFQHLDAVVLQLPMILYREFFKQMLLISVVSFTPAYFSMLTIGLLVDVVLDSVFFPVCAWAVKRRCIRTEFTVASNLSLESSLSSVEESLHQECFRSVIEKHRRYIAIKFIGKLVAVLAVITVVGTEIAMFETLDRPECCEVLPDINASAIRALCLDRGDGINRQLRTSNATACPRVTARHTRDSRQSLLLHFLLCLGMLVIEGSVASVCYAGVQSWGKAHAQKVETEVEKSLAFYHVGVEGVRPWLKRHQWLVSGYIIFAARVSIIQVVSVLYNS